ncbi:LOW QUALITY PROTEIN: protein transport protein Sec24C-like [Leucoraja erinacea]|uniref:LOW QUALITY PROTEIN: protein transport protein Sec24C-like n=1 Tax=Leucoraja erinaceus TaxID=7782 RepID=UPI00245528B2|nr:LOW QUALITY PROTEIN: protein transport protein Sec24C-like [Leucoraja erinacea]
MYQEIDVATDRLKHQMDGVEVHPSQLYSSMPYYQQYENNPPTFPNKCNGSIHTTSKCDVNSNCLDYDGASTAPYSSSGLPNPVHVLNSTMPTSYSRPPTFPSQGQHLNSGFQPILQSYHLPQPDSSQTPSHKLYGPFITGAGEGTVHSDPATAAEPSRQSGSLEESGNGMNLDLIPNPVQVAENDKELWESQVFCTNTRGQLPPLSTTNFRVEDQGFASPRFIRCTTYTFPCSPEMAKLSNLPLAAVVKPLATLPEGEAPVHLVDCGESDPIQCEKCAAYMCSMMQFLDNGHTFQCPFCDRISPVPDNYFHPIDYTGKRADRLHRPELSLGSYEFVLPEQQSKSGRVPGSVGFIFMIDVSYNAVRSGLLHLVCGQLKKVVHNLPREPGVEESAVRVGFLTYNNVLHFYNVKSSLVQPQMIVMTDFSDMTTPMFDGFLVNVKDSAALINNLLDRIPLLFADTPEADVLFGPAIQAGLEALKAAECFGKLFIFHSSLPTVAVQGTLRNRITGKEQSLFQPQSNYYQILAKQCVQQGCCVDLFLFSDQHVDMSSLLLVTFKTGGNLYNYSNFKAQEDAEKFQGDIQRNVEKVLGFKAAMNVHTRKGIRATKYYGSFHMNSSEMELAAIDSDKTLVVEFKHYGRLQEEDGVPIQFVLLYTTVHGQRRLRIHNVALNCSNQLTDTFRTSQAETLLNYFAKSAYHRVLSHSSKTVRDELVNQVTRMLACYRKHCAQASAHGGQMVMPQFLKVMPLYVNCLRKSKVLLEGADAPIDERAYLRHVVMSMDIAETNAFFYPCLLPIHDLNGSQVSLPRAVRCSRRWLSARGVYLLEDGLRLLLWIGMDTPTEWIQDVFGVPSFSEVNCGVGSLPVLANALSRQIRNVMARVRKERPRFLKLLIVKQTDDAERQFLQYLVEDKNPSGGASYADFLSHIHVSIQRSLQ